jgi:SAM-dependent methyltransferase
MLGDERTRAQQANLSMYGAFDERTYIQGAPHVKHRELRDLFAELAGEALGNGKSILDVGAGTGLATTPLLGRGLAITAVDSSAPTLEFYRSREPSAEFIVADVAEWLASSTQRFDLVMHVSMLHHVPDYLSLLRDSAVLVRSGGSLLTFQDPLRYSSQPKLDRIGEVASYFSWRVFQGRYRVGLATLGRRMRGVMLVSAPSDFGEYHVVRDGVDSDAIALQLSQQFSHVRKVSYWATQGRPQQWLGRVLGLRSYFAVVAKGRR